MKNNLVYWSIIVFINVIVGFYFTYRCLCKPLRIYLKKMKNQIINLNSKNQDDEQKNIYQK